MAYVDELDAAGLDEDPGAIDTPEIALQRFIHSSCRSASLFSSLPPGALQSAHGTSKDGGSQYEAEVCIAVVGSNGSRGRAPVRIGGGYHLVDRVAYDSNRPDSPDLLVASDTDRYAWGEVSPRTKDPVRYRFGTYLSGPPREKHGDVESERDRSGLRGDCSGLRKRDFEERGLFRTLRESGSIGNHTVKQRRPSSAPPKRERMTAGNSRSCQESTSRQEEPVPFPNSTCQVGHPIGEDDWSNLLGTLGIPGWHRWTGAKPLVYQGEPGPEERAELLYIRVPLPPAEVARRERLLEVLQVEESNVRLDEEISIVEGQKVIVPRRVIRETVVVEHEISEETQSDKIWSNNGSGLITVPVNQTQSDHEVKLKHDRIYERLQVCEVDGDETVVEKEIKVPVTRVIERVRVVEEEELHPAFESEISYVVNPKLKYDIQMSTMAEQVATLVWKRVLAFLGDAKIPKEERAGVDQSAALKLSEALAESRRLSASMKELEKEVRSLREKNIELTQIIDAKGEAEATRNLSIAVQTEPMQDCQESRQQAPDIEAIASQPPETPTRNVQIVQGLTQTVLFQDTIDERAEAGTEFKSSPRDISQKDAFQEITRVVDMESNVSLTTSIVEINEDMSKEALSLGDTDLERLKNKTQILLSEAFGDGRFERVCDKVSQELAAEEEQRVADIEDHELALLQQKQLQQRSLSPLKLVPELSTDFSQKCGMSHRGRSKSPPRIKHGVEVHIKRQKRARKQKYAVPRSVKKCGKAFSTSKQIVDYKNVQMFNMSWQADANEDGEGQANDDEEPHNREVVEVPVEVHVEHIIEREVPVPKYIQERIIEVPVEVERIIERIVEVPVVKVVEKHVEIPVEVIKYVEKTVERTVPQVVERVVERVVEVPERIIKVERIVEVPGPVRTVEVPGPERIIHVTVPGETQATLIEVPGPERIKEVPAQRPPSHSTEVQTNIKIGKQDAGSQTRPGRSAHVRIGGGFHLVDECVDIQTVVTEDDDKMYTPTTHFLASPEMDNYACGAITPGAAAGIRYRFGTYQREKNFKGSTKTNDGKEWWYSCAPSPSGAVFRVLKPSDAHADVAPPKPKNPKRPTSAPQGRGTAEKPTIGRHEFRQQALKLWRADQKHVLKTDKRAASNEEKLR